MHFQALWPVGCTCTARPRWCVSQTTKARGCGTSLLRNRSFSLALFGAVAGVPSRRGLGIAANPQLTMGPLLGLTVC